MKVTNELLMQEISYVRESTDKIEKHLEKLNGMVGTHSVEIATIKTRQNAVWAILGTLGGAVVTILVNYIV